MFSSVTEGLGKSIKGNYCEVLLLQGNAILFSRVEHFTCSLQLYSMVRVFWQWCCQTTRNFPTLQHYSLPSLTNSENNKISTDLILQKICILQTAEKFPFFLIARGGSWTQSEGKCFRATWAGRTNSTISTNHSLTSVTGSSSTTLGNVETQHKMARCLLTIWPTQ